MSSITFNASAQPSAAITSGKLTAPQTVAANPPQPASRSAKESDTVTISTAAQAALEASQISASSAASSGTYDFTNMTPSQMGGVAEDLFDSGKIDRKQLIMLWATGLTHGRIGENGKYLPPTEAEITSHINTPMDYVQYSKDRISYLESEGLTSDPQYGYESWKGLLALFQNTTSRSAA
jgi:hypothetical protein